ncbi:hypothetical protein C5167_020812 [Papaver somniferum]|uniref:Uncharacterized protein n=1 Tax=Papaver somniferum TaxID=3469 RepID=A0A4Y7IY92_PAPSO|nr:hypothetical protein C5167_020812 [Papaver somniferum]
MLPPRKHTSTIGEALNYAMTKMCCQSFLCEEPDSMVETSLTLTQGQHAGLMMLAIHRHLVQLEEFRRFRRKWKQSKIKISQLEKNLATEKSIADNLRCLNEELREMKSKTHQFAAEDARVENVKLKT